VVRLLATVLRWSRVVLAASALVDSDGFAKSRGGSLLGGVEILIAAAARGRTARGARTDQASRPESAPESWLGAINSLRLPNSDRDPSARESLKNRRLAHDGIDGSSDFP
jgi:hypothetical protein